MIINSLSLSVGHNDSSNSSRGFEFEVKCSTALPSLLLIVGMIEGIISLTLLSQKSLRQLPLRRSLLMLCVTSSVLLLIGMSRYVILCASHVDIRKYSLITCFVHRSLTDMMLQLSTTTVAFISLERYLAVVYPYIIPQTRVKVERIGLLSIFIFSLAFNSHYFFTMDKISNETATTNLTAKQFHCHVKQYYEKWVLLLMSFVQTYIPFVVILVSNVSLIRRLYVMRRKRSERRLSACSIRAKYMAKIIRISQHRRSFHFENEKVVASCSEANLTVLKVIKPINTTETENAKVCRHGGENAHIHDRDHRCSREAKAAQLILLITVSFVLFHVPYECYSLLLTHHGVDKNTPLSRDLWVVFVYMIYCYNLLLFPIYILYHPVIRAQIMAWFLRVKNWGENVEKIYLSKQNSENAV